MNLALARIQLEGVLERSLFGVFPAHLNIVLPRFLEHLDVADCDFADHFSRDSDHDRPRRDLLPAWHYSTDSEYAVLSNCRAIKNYCANADEAFIPDSACMDDGV